MAGTTKLMTPGGGGVNLTPASSIASDVTVNLPSQDCTLGIQGPAFSAYQNAGVSCSGATYTKCLFQVEEFDTNNNFASSTFTPTVAGYYQINFAFIMAGQNIERQALIYKNGTAYKGANDDPNAYGSSVSCLVYCNGTTDYIEAYVYTGTTTTTSADQTATWFQGAMVRAA